MTLRDLLSVYATRHALADRTATLVANSIDRFEAFLERPATLDDFDDATLARFARWRSEDRHWRGRVPRPATVKKDVSHLSALWQHAAKKRMTRSDGSLIEHPDLPRGLVRVALRPPRGYTLDEVDRMIAHARGREGHVGPVPAWWLWETLLSVAWQTGERIGGLLALRWRDVDLDGCRVTFDGATRKGGVKTITRSITGELASMLAQHRRQDDDLVWPWLEHRQPTSLWASLKVLCRRAGVTCRGFHSIRKASGSYVAAGGGDASTFLSHSDAKTTRDHYLDDRIVRGADPLDLLPRLPSQGAAPVADVAPEPIPVEPAPRAPGEALEAGRRVGVSLAARGLACPPRTQQDALAVAAGIAPDDVPAFARGVIAGWTAGQGDAA
jgi:integrase